MLKVQNFRELTGTEYVKADIACKHDKALEKKGWAERLAHFDSLDFTNKKTFKEASNPIGLRAAVNAYQKSQQGEAVGYMISLDASSSGLQLLSLLVSCPISWKLCGGDENILDAYAEIYRSMGGEIQINPSSNGAHLVQNGAKLSKTLDRKDVKQSIMTALYGSTATPKAIFGEDVDVFYDTMEKMAPGAWDLNLGIQELWDEVQGTTYDWVLPDNFYACIETNDKNVIPFMFLDKEYQVIQKVNERPRFHKGLGPNLIHSIDGMIVREMYRRCMFNQKTVDRVVNLIANQTGQFIYGTDGSSAELVQALWEHYLESGFLSVRILDYLYEDTMGLVDPAVIEQLISTLPAKPFELVCVHDCFRCHPNYGNDLRRQYNYILADINESKLLPFIASQVAQKPIQARKVGKINRAVIMNANYTLS